MMAQEEGIAIAVGDDCRENNTEECVDNNNSKPTIVSNMNEEDSEAHANFFAQRFQTEWRICLKRATSDFDRAMQLFWCEVRFHIFEKRIVMTLALMLSSLLLL